MSTLFSKYAPSWSFEHSSTRNNGRQENSSREYATSKRLHFLEDDSDDELKAISVQPSARGGKPFGSTKIKTEPQSQSPPTARPSSSVHGVQTVTGGHKRDLGAMLAGLKETHREEKRQKQASAGSLDPIMRASTLERHGGSARPPAERSIGVNDTAPMRLAPSRRNVSPPVIRAPRSSTNIAGTPGGKLEDMLNRRQESPQKPARRSGRCSPPAQSRPCNSTISAAAKPAIMPAGTSRPRPGPGEPTKKPMSTQPSDTQDEKALITAETPRTIPNLPHGLPLVTASTAKKPTASFGSGTFHAPFQLEDSDDEDDEAASRPLAIVKMEPGRSEGSSAGVADPNTMALKAQQWEESNRLRQMKLSSKGAGHATGIQALSAKGSSAETAFGSASEGGSKISSFIEAPRILYSPTKRQQAQTINQIVSVGNPDFSRKQDVTTKTATNTQLRNLCADGKSLSQLLESTKHSKAVPSRAATAARRHVNELKSCADSNNPAAARVDDGMQRLRAIKRNNERKRQEELEAQINIINEKVAAKEKERQDTARKADQAYRNPQQAQKEGPATRVKEAEQSIAQAAKSSGKTVVNESSSDAALFILLPAEKEPVSKAAAHAEEAATREAWRQESIAVALKDTEAERRAAADEGAQPKTLSPEEQAAAAKWAEDRKKRAAEDAKQQLEARKREEARKEEEKRRWEEQQKEEKEREDFVRKAQETARKAAEDAEKARESSLSKLNSAAPAPPRRSVTTAETADAAPSTSKQQPSRPRSAPKPVSTAQELRIKEQQARIQRHKKAEEAAEHDNDDLTLDNSDDAGQAMKRPGRDLTVLRGRDSAPTPPDTPCKLHNGVQPAPLQQPVSLNSDAGRARVAQWKRQSSVKPVAAAPPPVQHARKGHDRALGEILREDIWLLTIRREGLTFSKIAGLFAKKWNKTREAGTHSKRYNQVKAAVQAAGVTDDLLQRVLAGSANAREELNLAVHGTWPLPATGRSISGNRAGQDRQRDERGHFISAKRPASSSAPADDRTSLPGPAAIEVRAARSAADGTHIDTATRPTIGGKKLCDGYWQSLLEQEREICEREIARVEKAYGRREETPITDHDMVHWIYQVSRREISQAELDAEAEEAEQDEEDEGYAYSDGPTDEGEYGIDKKPWIDCCDPVESLEEANAEARYQATRFLDRATARGDMTQGNSIENWFQDGMQFIRTTIHGVGIIEACVSRTRRTALDGIHPTNKEGWAPSRVFFVMEREIVTVDGKTIDSTKTTNTQLWTSLQLANEQAAKRWVGLTFRSQTINMRLREKEIEAEISEMFHALDADEEELFNKSVKDDGKGRGISVWVEEGWLRGPRN